MPGTKGKTGRHTNRSNQWLAGTAERQRTDEVFAFKPKLSVIEAVKSDLQEREISKTEWLDMAVESLLGIAASSESEREVQPHCRGDDELPEIGFNHPLVQEALSDSLEKKRIAIARERKQKRPDKGLIEQWEKEIEELEVILS